MNPIERSEGDFWYFVIIFKHGMSIDWEMAISNLHTEHVLRYTTPKHLFGLAYIIGTTFTNHEVHHPASLAIHEMWGFKGPPHSEERKHFLFLWGGNASNYHMEMNQRLDNVFSFLIHFWTRTSLSLIEVALLKVMEGLVGTKVLTLGSSVSTVQCLQTVCLIALCYLEKRRIILVESELESSLTLCLNNSSNRDWVTVLLFALRKHDWL